MKKLILVLPFLAACAAPVTRHDFDTTGFDRDMQLRLLTDDKFCSQIQKDFKKRFGISSINYAQCMYERGYRFKEKTVTNEE